VQEEDNSNHYPTLALNKEATEALMSAIDQKKSQRCTVKMLSDKGQV
jgi:hypothetical protein